MDRTIKIIPSRSSVGSYSVEPHAFLQVNITVDSQNPFLPIFFKALDAETQTKVLLNNSLSLSLIPNMNNTMKQNLTITPQGLSLDLLVLFLFLCERKGLSLDFLVLFFSSGKYYVNFLCGFEWVNQTYLTIFLFWYLNSFESRSNPFVRSSRRWRRTDPRKPGSYSKRWYPGIGLKRITTERQQRLLEQWIQIRWMYSPAIQLSRRIHYCTQN